MAGEALDCKSKDGVEASFYQLRGDFMVILQIRSSFKTCQGYSLPTGGGVGGSVDWCLAVTSVCGSHWSVGLQA